MSSFRHELDQQARNLSDLRSVDVTGAPNWERRLVAAYQQHRKPLVDTAQYLLGCRAKAEDVVQDAFLKVWDQGFADNVRDEGRLCFRLHQNGSWLEPGHCTMRCLLSQSCLLVYRRC